ncbi:hypothetical protein DNTS_016969, partial [Danionella cerebrum]
SSDEALGNCCIVNFWSQKVQVGPTACSQADYWFIQAENGGLGGWRRTGNGMGVDSLLTHFSPEELHLGDLRQVISDTSFPLYTGTLSDRHKQEELNCVLLLESEGLYTRIKVTLTKCSSVEADEGLSAVQFQPRGAPEERQWNETDCDFSPALLLEPDDGLSSSSIPTEDDEEEKQNTRQLFILMSAAITYSLPVFNEQNNNFLYPVISPQTTEAYNDSITETPTGLHVSRNGAESQLKDQDLSTRVNSALITPAPRQRQNKEPPWGHTFKGSFSLRLMESTSISSPLKVLPVMTCKFLVVSPLLSFERERERERGMLGEMLSSAQEKGMSDGDPQTHVSSLLLKIPAETDLPLHPLAPVFVPWHPLVPDESRWNSSSETLRIEQPFTFLLKRNTADDAKTTYLDCCDVYGETGVHNFSSFAPRSNLFKLKSFPRSRSRVCVDGTVACPCQTEPVPERASCAMCLCGSLQATGPSNNKKCKELEEISTSSSSPAGHHTGHFTGTDGRFTHTDASFQPVLAEMLQPANRAEIINTGGRLNVLLNSQSSTGQGNQRARATAPERAVTERSVWYVLISTMEQVWRLHSDHRLPLEQAKPASSRTLTKSPDNIVSALSEHTAHTPRIVLVITNPTEEQLDMSFPQLSYPQFLNASTEVYGPERAGVMPSSPREGSSESSANPATAAAAITPMLGMYANPWTVQNYSAFLPYNSAELALLSQMGSQYELKDNPGAHPPGFAVHAASGFYPYGQYQYGDPARAKSATRETTSTLKAWLQEHKKNPYPTKGEKIMLAIITKMTLTQVSTWFANARRRLKKENKVTWGRSAEDRDGRIFDSDNEDDADKNDDEEEIDLETIDMDKDEEPCKEPSDNPRVETPTLKNTDSPVSSGNKDQNVVKSVGEVSLGGPVCQRPGNSKPKIWSLAETATSPDNAQKLGAPSVPAGHLRASSSSHPAFLSTNGIYTCQIGKLHNWASAAFLGANSLIGVRSLLSQNSNFPNHSPLTNSDKKPSSASGSPCLDSDTSSDSFSPKYTDQENVQRIESPTLASRPPFPVIHDRSHHETSQRALKTIS